jgi:hypothetical protein
VQFDAGAFHGGHCEAFTFDGAKGHGFLRNFGTFLSTIAMDAGLAKSAGENALFTGKYLNWSHAWPRPWAGRAFENHNQVN